LLQVPKTKPAPHGARAGPARSICSGNQTGSDLLKEMQRRNQQMAIVVDEHGSVAGIVTVEDLVERNHRRNRGR